MIEVIELGIKEDEAVLSIVSVFEYIKTKRLRQGYPKVYYRKDYGNDFDLMNRLNLFFFQTRVYSSEIRIVEVSNAIVKFLNDFKVVSVNTYKVERYKDFIDEMFRVHQEFTQTTMSELVATQTFSKIERHQNKGGVIIGKGVSTETKSVTEDKVQ